MLVVELAFPYFRLGKLEGFVERVRPSKRGSWFSVDVISRATLIGVAWWCVTINTVVE